MKTIHQTFLILFTAVCLLCCKKNKGSNDPEPLDPNVKQHGMVIGTPVQQTIGPAGGTMKSPDNGIQLVIPQGAVENNVNFILQEVTNTAGPGSIGKSYRLLPENVQFSKDIEITFKLADSVFIKNGLKLDLIRLVYQDGDGKWHFAAEPTFVDYAQTLTVKTRHFSDWASLAGINIVNDGSDELSAGETTTFRVITTELQGDASDDDLLGPTIASKADEWGSLDATAGTISGNQHSATYTAPSTIAVPRYVEPFAYFKEVPIKSSESYSRFSVKTPRLLLLPDEYLIWWDQGHFTWATNNNQYKSVLEKSVSQDGKLGITGREGNTSNSPARMSIFCEKSTGGVYDFDLEKNTVSMWDGTHYYNNVYRGCDLNDSSTEGTIIITKNDGQYIEGIVTGELKNISRSCSQADTQKIKAKFRIKKP